ncbi:hypothetical protein LAV_00206 [Sphingobium phage Lacusarx]|uniref:Uncharacterized protein n=1 Tax=Sphingobium phage Lacusarx TaxID=1980139 RepID=A0A1W6DXF7_9CAUD|nr:hypothetical protein FDH44_gp097 [Sphingobium phage Lacusarx]ARK07581.1 hypothetical protein LAV_00206 [Sphingobium phage Lacusarx]
MALTHDPYFHLQPDHGQPDAVQEEWYEHLDSAMDRGLSEDEAREEWDRLEALRRQSRRPPDYQRGGNF